MPQRVTAAIRRRGGGHRIGGSDADRGTRSAEHTAAATRRHAGRRAALYDQLNKLEVALRQLAAREEGAETAVFAANRLVDTRRLIADTSAWVRQIARTQGGQLHGRGRSRSVSAGHEDRRAGRQAGHDRADAGRPDAAQRRQPAAADRRKGPRVYHHARQAGVAEPVGRGVRAAQQPIAAGHRTPEGGRRRARRRPKKRTTN